MAKFHTAHKLTLMAHSPKHHTEMGCFVADAGKRDWDELTAEYGAMLMEGLAVMGTRGKQSSPIHTFEMLVADAAPWAWHPGHSRDLVG